MAFSADEIRFNSNWTDGASVNHWLMDTNGAFIAGSNTGKIQCSTHISVGGAATDAKIELGDE